MKNIIYIIFMATLWSSCKLGYHRFALGEIEEARLNEISGIVASHNYPNHFWVINDSGDDPNIYLINSKGALIHTLTIANATNRDWEALAISVHDGKSMIYVGDIGDNRAKREQIQIYQIEEPDSTSSTITAITMNISYAEGARDAECLMYDASSNELIIVTKREKKVLVYSFPFEDADVELTKKGNIDFRYVTGGDINKNGEVLIKNYGHVYYWPKATFNSTAQNLMCQKPQQIKYRREPQGEAIAWDNDQLRFYTMSEKRGKKPVTFYEYRLK